LIEELIFTRTITSHEAYMIVLRTIGRAPENTEVRGDRLIFTFDPELSHDDRVLLDQRISKIGYFLLERD